MRLTSKFPFLFWRRACVCFCNYVSGLFSVATVFDLEYQCTPFFSMLCYFHISMATKFSGILSYIYWCTHCHILQGCARVLSAVKATITRLNQRRVDFLSKSENHVLSQATQYAFCVRVFVSDLNSRAQTEEYNGRFDGRKKSTLKQHLEGTMFFLFCYIYRCAQTGQSGERYMCQTNEIWRNTCVRNQFTVYVCMFRFTVRHLEEFECVTWSYQCIIPSQNVSERNVFDGEDACTVYSMICSLSCVSVTNSKCFDDICSVSVSDGLLCRSHIYHFPRKSNITVSQSNLGVSRSPL